MRALAVLAPALILAACASAPPAATLPQGEPPRASVAVPPPAEPLRLGETRLDAALARYGPADIDRRDGAGAVLTWRLQRCALILGFVDRGQGPILDFAEAGQRRDDQPASPLPACLAEAEARGRAGRPVS